MKVPIIQGVFKNMCNLITAINTSAQSGGQHDSNSRADIAALCAIVATNNVKEHRVRQNIVHKTIKQYLAQSRPCSKELFRAMAPYATGELPSELSLDILDEDYKMAKVDAREYKQAASSTATTVSLKQ